MLKKRDDATPFSGPLATPVRKRAPSLLESEEERQKRISKWVEEDFSKLELLRQHYGIEPGPYQDTHLALALAREFVPGFQEEKPRGRRNKWNWLTMSMLVVEVDRLVQDAGSSRQGPTWACGELARRAPWKGFVASKDSELTLGADAGEALRVVYYQFKKNKFVGITWDAFRYHEGNGTIPEWDLFVTDALREALADSA